MSIISFATREVLLSKGQIHLVHNQYFKHHISKGIIHIKKHSNTRCHSISSLSYKHRWAKSW